MLIPEEEQTHTHFYPQEQFHLRDILFQRLKTTFANEAVCSGNKLFPEPEGIGLHIYKITEECVIPTGDTNAFNEQKTCKTS